MSQTRLRPDRSVETELLRHHRIVAGMDEVGRGALAGPVSVGVALVDATTPDAFPAGLADSKQLSALRRERLVEPCRQWILDGAVGHASPAEIDTWGIVTALRLAGMRALAEVRGRGYAPDVVILDGVADWLTAPQGDLCDALGVGISLPDVRVPLVRMEVKADARCAVVAAASVLAKVERDTLMTALPDPGYAWASNKGYASAAHMAALKALGPCEQHRRSWKLPR